MEEIKFALVEEKPKEGKEVRSHILETIEVEKDGKNYVQSKLKPEIIKPNFVNKINEDIFRVETSYYTYIVQLVKTRKKTKRSKTHLMLIEDDPKLGQKLKGHILGMDKNGMTGFYRDRTTSMVIVKEFEKKVYKVVTEKGHVYYCIRQEDTLY